MQKINGYSGDCTFQAIKVYRSPGYTKEMKSSKNSKRLLIVAHRDLDGIISALFLGLGVLAEYDAIDVIFSKPYMHSRLGSYICKHGLQNKYTTISMVDIATSPLDLGAAKYILCFLAPKLGHLFDHHVGWLRVVPHCYDELNDTGKTLKVLSNGVNTVTSLKKLKSRRAKTDSGDIIVSVGNTVSCAQMVYDYFNLFKLDICLLSELLLLANIADDITFRQESMTPGVTSTVPYKLFRSSLLMGLTLEDFMLKLAKVLFSVDAEFSSLNGIFEIPEESDSAIDDRREVNNLDEYFRKSGEIVYNGPGPKVLYLSHVKESVQGGMTTLCEEAYKQHDGECGVVIFRNITMEIGVRIKSRTAHTIAHNLPGLNLVEIFDLKGGSPRRITLYGSNVNIDYILDCLRPYLDRRKR